MPKFILALILVGIIAYVFAGDPKEVYMPNEAGGFVTLIEDWCQIDPAIQQGFLHRAYATEGDGTRHEGCWIRPSTADAPQVQGVEIIPLVNVWFDGEIVTYRQELFSFEKKRWEIQTPAIEVKPTL